MKVKVKVKANMKMKTNIKLKAKVKVILLQDNLVKQGMTTKNAGNLLSSVVTHTRRVSYDVSIVRRFMQSQRLAKLISRQGRIERNSNTADL